MSFRRGENVFRRGFNPSPRTEETYIPDGTEKDNLRWLSRIPSGMTFPEVLGNTDKNVRPKALKAENVL